MRILNVGETGIEAARAALRRTTLQDNPRVEAIVRDIVADVRVRGDEALLELGRRFDAPSLDRLDVPQAEWAAAEGHARLVVLFIDNGGNVNARDQDGATPLYFAARSGHLNVSECLVKSGAKVDEKDAKGNTPLIVAAHGDHVLLARLLADSGANVDARGQGMRTPLFWTSTREMAELLIQKGASINVADQWGNSPLHIVAEKGNAPLVEFLVANGAAVDAVNRKGRSALHWAANRQTVNVLLSNRADAGKKDREGRTPRDLAVLEGRQEVATALTHPERTTKR